MDVDRLADFDWGGAIFACTLEELDRATTYRGQSAVMTVSIPFILLEIWFYEYMGTMTPLVRRITVAFPRIRCWGSDVRLQGADQVSRSIIIARNQIELRTSHGIVWRPWTNAPEFLTDPNVQLALILSRARVMFRGLAESDMAYLGERCWRQLTGRISIPSDAPPDIATGMGYDTEMVDAIWVTTSWPDQGRYVLFTSQVVYDLYWAAVSHGPIGEALYRSGNIDFVGRGGMRRGMRIHGPSQPLDRPHTYETAPAGPPPLNDPWSFAIGTAGGDSRLPIPSMDDSSVATLEPMLQTLQLEELRVRYSDSIRMNVGMREAVYEYTRDIAAQESQRYNNLLEMYSNLQANQQMTRDNAEPSSRRRARDSSNGDDDSHVSESTESRGSRRSRGNRRSSESRR